MLPTSPDTTSESPGQLSLPVRLLIDVVDLQVCRLISILNHIHHDGARPHRKPVTTNFPGLWR